MVIRPCLCLTLLFVFNNSIFNSGLYLFSLLASYVNPDHLQYFRFIGRLIAMVRKSNHVILRGLVTVMDSSEWSGQCKVLHWLCDGFVDCRLFITESSLTEDSLFLSTRGCWTRSKRWKIWSQLTRSFITRWFGSSTKYFTVVQKGLFLADKLLDALF